MVASIFTEFGSLAFAVMVPENLSNSPFTSEIIMCRALKLIFEWTGSMFHVSALAPPAVMAAIAKIADAKIAAAPVFLNHTEDSLRFHSHPPELLGDPYRVLEPASAYINREDVHDRGSENQEVNLRLS